MAIEKVKMGPSREREGEVVGCQQFESCTTFNAGEVTHRDARPVRRWLAVAFLLAALLVAKPAAAVTIFDRATNTQIRGYLVEQDDRRVVIDVALPDGSTKRTTFDASSVDVYPAVDRDRLASLASERPQQYKAYADELSEKWLDPEARSTAIRLYLIAAYLDRDKLGRGSFIAMADLAQTPEEERRYRAMAYLLDPDRDRSVFRSPGATAAPQAAGVGDIPLLKQGLRAFWSGHKQLAARFADQEAFQQALAANSSTLSSEEFSAAAKGPGESLPAATTQKVVALAVALRGGVAAAPQETAADSDSPHWSGIDMQRPPAYTLLTLETVTPFDPREYHYRDGRWVADRD